MTLRERYARDGIVFPLPALTAGEVAAFRDFAEEHLARDVDDVRRLHLDHEWAHALATHPAVAGPVEELLGDADDIAIWGTLLLRKPPHSDEYVAWHQDGAYSEFLGDDALSAWIALGDSTAESGCMRVIAGSHRARLPHVETGDAHNLLRQRQTVGAAIDDAAAVDVTLRAGEMSLHHLDLIHGSSPNRSATARTGFIVRFVRVSGAGTWSPLTPVRRSV
jgi:ectoine hydroxylase-related dioxygenase (phytanoyl-CoA dioxygenase family)